MNIVHIVWGLGIGGVESMLVDIANYQVKTNTVSIIIINNIINPTLSNKLDPQIKLYQCNRKVGSKNPLPLIRLNLNIHRIKPDIIHVHMEGIIKYIWFNFNAKIVRTIHNIACSGKDFPKFNKLFAISKAVQSRTLQQGFKSKVIYNGIHFNYIKARTHQRNSIFRIVNVGRLENDKGQRILIEAAKLLKEQNNIVFEIDLIGGGNNEITLKNLVKDYNLDNIIHFLGFQSRTFVYENLCKYDLYVQPSIFEGFGLTIAEAIAAKVPVLTSDLEGPIEVIANGKYGKSFKCGDANDLAKIIYKFYNGEITIDTNAAWNFAYENFNIDTTAQKYLDEYATLSV